MSSILKPVLGSQLQLGHPLACGLVGCWLFNEGTGGKVFDLSGNGNTGTLISNVVWSPGKFGNTLEFDGSGGDYIEVVDSPLISFDSGSQDFSIIVLAKRDGSGGDYLLDKRTGNNDGWDLRFVSDVLWCQVSSKDVKGSRTITDSDWHFLGVSVNRAGNGQIYVDGIADGTSDAIGGEVIDAPVNLRIGHSTLSTSDAFDGLIDYVMIFNRALSASEIALLYREPFCMFERDLIELWVGATSVGAPPVGMAGAMTTNTGYWGW